MALSERERRFVDAYMGEAAGNATKAAISAGYSPRSAAAQASRLLRKRNVLDQIERAAKNDPGVWTREERQRFWTQVAQGAGTFGDTSMRDRLKASELLAKSQADFVERVQHEGQLDVNVKDVRESLASKLAGLATRIGA